MNKYVFLTVFLCAWALTSAKPNHEQKETSNSTETSEKHFKKLAQEINDKYNTTLFLDAIKMGEVVKEKCPNIEEKMGTVAEEIQTCVEEIQMGSDTFCSIVSKNFVKCYKPAGELISTCLPEESKDLPMMMGKMIHAVIGQSCHSTIEEILELFNPCILETDPRKLPACKQIQTTIEEHSSKVPSKSLICQTLPKVKNCIKAMLDGSCENQITKNAVIKFNDAMEHAVKDECDALNKA